MLGRLFGFSKPKTDKKAVAPSKKYKVKVHVSKLIVVDESGNEIATVNPGRSVRSADVNWSKKLFVVVPSITKCVLLLDENGKVVRTIVQHGTDVKSARFKSGNIEATFASGKKRLFKITGELISTTRETNS